MLVNPQSLTITQKQVQELQLTEDLTNPAVMSMLALLESGADIELTGEPSDRLVEIPTKPGDRFVVPFSDATVRGYKLRQSCRRAKRLLHGVSDHLKT